MKRLIPAVVAVLFAVSALASPGEQAFNAGKQAMKEDNNEKAAELFEKAVAAEPNNANYHYHLGQVYGSLAQEASLFGKASLASKTKAEFEKTVQLDPNFLDGRFALIDYYTMAPAIMGGSQEKALQQAAEIKKRDALMGHRAYARIYNRDKKPDVARKEMIDAVREQPTNPKAHYFYSGFLFNEKNYKGAGEEAEAALKLDPSFMPAYLRVGQVAARTGVNLARGEEALKKYLAYTPTDQEPQHASTWYWLGALYEKANRKAEAKAAYLNSQKLAPKSKEVAEALKRVS